MRPFPWVGKPSRGIRRRRTGARKTELVISGYPIGPKDFGLKRCSVQASKKRGSHRPKGPFSKLKNQVGVLTSTGKVYCRIQA
ncbi:hypothetical protein G5I_13897 [Acromyrmex echinatior]|uniref:Uncharacterized protein n=1 Tax=Acromyrmex echinatior TaxID=103372 RepID=F4X693_ACREC|nr:hypothetical protein G5I_13897 [Acromyrmex echinatior]